MDIFSNLSIIIPNHNEPRIKEMVDLVFREFPHAEVIVSNDPEGKGKGWAVREGIKNSSKYYIAIIDGDLDIQPRKLHRLIEVSHIYDIVVGRKALWNLPFHRKPITIFSRKIINLLFRLPIDTQTGIKLFPRETLSDFRTDGYMYDVELLYNARKKGYIIGEVLLTVYSSKKKSIGCLIKCLWETLRIYANTLSSK